MKTAEFLKLKGLLRESFHLNKYESEMLAFLLFNGECEMNKIDVNVPRPRKYDIVQSLEKEGFIEIKKRKKAIHSRPHKDYVKPEKTKCIAFDLEKIIKNRKKQKQLQLNEEAKVMDGFKPLINKQIKTLKMEK